MRIRELRASLTSVTETLANALVHPDCPEPSWTATQWKLARAVAIMQGISPLLARGNRWRGDARWGDFLLEQRLHTQSRHQRIVELGSRLADAARAAGIAFIPLKGDALHALGIYEPGDRPMADLDVLVAPGDLASMVGLIVPLGYRVERDNPAGAVLVPVEPPGRIVAGEHADSLISIDVHAQVCQPMPVTPVDITTELWPDTKVVGANPYRSRAALMLHLLMHAAVNMQWRALRMIQLHDIALLARELSAQDWQALESRRELPCWWYPPLALLQRYYPQSIPISLIDAARAATTPLLRAWSPRLRISDVSLSNPGRSVIRALSWCGSVGEAVRYAGRTLRLGAKVLSGGVRDRNTSRVLAPWITPSRRWSMFQVLLHRPRPETLMMVESVLAEEN